MVYAQGETEIDGLTMNVTSMTYLVPMFWYTSQMWRLHARDTGFISFTCPPGNGFCNRFNCSIVHQSEVRF